MGGAGPRPHIAEPAVTSFYARTDVFRKGGELNVPQEFRDGTATLAQATAWSYALLDGAGDMEIHDDDLIPGGMGGLFIGDRSNVGSGGNFYLVFARDAAGLRYVGYILNVGRCVPPDAMGRPRRVTHWRTGGGQGTGTLLVLTAEGFMDTAKVDASGGDGASEELRRTYDTLFAGDGPLTQEALTAVFGEAAAVSAPH